MPLLRKAIKAGTRVPVLFPAWGLLSVGMTAIFGTLQGRLPMVIDYERVLAIPLPLLVAVRGWVVVVIGRCFRYSRVPNARGALINGGVGTTQRS